MDQTRPVTQEMVRKSSVHSMTLWCLNREKLLKALLRQAAVDASEERGNGIGSDGTDGSHD